MCKKNYALYFQIIKLSEKILTAYNVSTEYYTKLSPNLPGLTQYEEPLDDASTSADDNAVSGNL